MKHKVWFNKNKEDYKEIANIDNLLVVYRAANPIEGMEDFLSFLIWDETTKDHKLISCTISSFCSSYNYSRELTRKLSTTEFTITPDGDFEITKNISPTDN